MATQLSLGQRKASRPAASHDPQRRVVCLVLPELACELARWSHIKPRQPTTPTAKDHPRPLAVVLLDGSDKTDLVELNRNLEPKAVISAVDAAARRLGIEPGQSVLEARCLCAAIDVIALPRELLQNTLARIAESLLDRASVVALEAPDSIWLEIGSVSRTFGGETALASEIIERVRCLGHRLSLAIADGPRLAQLFARYAQSSYPEGFIVPNADTQQAVQALPLTTLPLTPENLGWLGRLGLLTLGDLVQLPKGELVERLGAQSEQWVRLANGDDPEPLVPLEPKRIVTESLDWDEPVEGLERMRFILRRLTQNLEARLTARGEAAERLHITFKHDRAIARHRGVPVDTQLQFELSSPLWYAEELERIIVLRCEKTCLLAPTVGIELSILSIVPRVAKQLSLSRLLAGFDGHAPAEDGMPLLLAELESEIGRERVGQLALANSHRPEKTSLFAPCRSEATALPKKGSSPRPQLRKTGAPVGLQPTDKQTHFSRLTRLLERPVPLTPPIRIGSTLFVGKDAYVISAVRFEQRLENVEWWNNESVSRDYVRIWLKGATGGMEVLAYVDRPQGRCFLQAVAD